MQELLVFMASPSDVEPERAAVLEVAQDVDLRVAREYGLVIRALGSQHVKPGLGRPQGIINPTVESCDIFVGITNLRWGTETGKFTSGFEEELAVIADRHENGEDVEVLLYLRELEDETQAEPAMQAFREQIKKNAWLRFFSDTEDFRRQLHSDLNQVLAQKVGGELRQLREGGPAAQALPESGAAKELPAGDSETQAEIDAAEEQAQGAVKLVASGDEDDHALIRAHLAVSARMSWKLTAGTLDLHDVNRLYQHRDGITLTGEERSLVFRTAAAHGVSAPIWGLDPLDDGDARRWLIGIVLDDREDHIRAGAARELGPVGINEVVDRVVDSGDATADQVFGRLLGLGVSGVTRVVIDAVATSGREEAVDILRTLFSADTESVRVFERLGPLLVGTNLEAALEHARSRPSWVKDEYIDALQRRADDLPRDELVSMLTGSPSDIELALQLFASRSDELPDLSALLGHKSVRVRRAAVTTLTVRGVALNMDAFDNALSDKDGSRSYFRSLEPGPTDDELRCAQFGLRNPEERAAYLNWTELRGGEALTAAVIAGDAGAIELARRSLGDELVQVREEHIEAAAEASDAGAMVRHMAERYENLMNQLWAQGALQGLADVDEGRLEPGDVELAIRHLDGSAVRREPAAALLARTATADHLQTLVHAAVAAHSPDARRALLERALDLCGPSATLKTVSAAEKDERLLSLLFSLLHERGDEVESDVLVPHLVNSESSVRRAALRLLTRDLRPDSRRALLDELADTTPRFYDIVGILDRLVHGPRFAEARAQAVLDRADD